MAYTKNTPLFGYTPASFGTRFLSPDKLHCKLSPGPAITPWISGKFRPLLRRV